MKLDSKRSDYKLRVYVRLSQVFIPSTISWARKTKPILHHVDCVEALFGVHAQVSFVGCHQLRTPLLMGLMKAMQEVLMSYLMNILGGASKLHFDRKAHQQDSGWCSHGSHDVAPILFF